MAYAEKRVKVRDLLMDQENPRHDPIDNERDIIARLLKSENVRALAASVSRLGSLSPIEKMAVFPHPALKGRYVTAEGNRRLCALRLLADPEKAPEESQRRIFRELQKKIGGAIEELNVVVFDTRDETRPWLELRHEGYRDGEGIKEWDARQKTRFNQAGDRKGNPNALSLSLIGYARANDLISADEAASLSLTTLTRFLANPVFRSTMGITSMPTDSTVGINVDRDQFNRALRHFMCESLRPRSPVNSRTNVEDRVAYAKKLVTTGVAPKISARAPVLDLNVDTGEALPRGDTTASQTSRRRDNRNPRDRTHVIPSAFRARIADPIVRRIYGELKEIDALNLPFAANYLLRALIELTTRRYCAKYGITYQERDLHKTILEIENDLKSKGVKDHILKPLRVMANNKDANYSPESLGSVVHGNGITNRRQLNDSWDNVQGALQEMFKRI